MKFIPTRKNAPARTFVERLQGGRLVSDQESGAQTWEFDIAKASPVTKPAYAELLTQPVRLPRPCRDPRPRKINHVGLAVPDIEAFLRQDCAPVRGIIRGPMIVNDRQKVRELYVTDGTTTSNCWSHSERARPSKHSSRGIPLAASFTSRSK